MKIYVLDLDNNTFYDTTFGENMEFQVHIYGQNDISQIVNVSYKSFKTIHCTVKIQI